jgi:CheY-like chemotaxis protein
VADEKLKFLIVNDDILVCLVTGQTIRKFDPDITIAIKGDGKSALKYLCEILADNKLKNPNVIFLDVTMPVMDGEAFLEGFTQLGKNQKDILVYILTATADLAVKQLAARYSFVKGIYELPLTADKLTNIYNILITRSLI